MRNDNVLIRVIPEPEKPKSSLLFRPKTAKQRKDGTIRGVVIDAGPGYRISNGRGPIQPTELEPGDLVLCRALAGQTLDDFSLDRESERQNSGTVDGDLRIIRADEVLAVLEDVTEAQLAEISTTAEEYSVQHPRVG